MNILIDHGSTHNAGDTSMLEAIVQQYMDRYPDAALHVVDRPRMESEVWSWKGPRRQPVYRLHEPLSFGMQGAPREWLLRNISRVGHFVVRKGTAARGFALEFPGWIVNPAELELSKPEFSRTMAEYCRPFDALHVVGGGMFTDVFDWGLIQRSALIRTFSEQGKPVVLTGQQIGPFKSVHSRYLAAHTLRAADFVSVREPTDSLAFCKDAGVRNYAVTGDDSFGLKADADEGRDRLAAYGLEPGQFLAVNVRLGYYVPEHERHVSRIGRMVRELADRLELPALVVPIALSGRKSDIKSGHRLREIVGDGLQVLDDPDLTATSVKSVMGLAYGGVGVSYHFCTFALSQGVPAVCIHDGAYYGQKAAGLAAFWDEERLDLPLRGLEVQKGVEHLARVLQDEAFRRALSSRAQEAVSIWEEAFEEQVLPRLQQELAT